PEQRRVANLAASFRQAVTRHQALVVSARRARLALAASAWRAEHPRRPLAELGELATGRTPSTKESRYWKPSARPFIPPGDLDGRLSISIAARNVSRAGAAAARELPTDSVVQVCIGATIGKAARLSVPAVINQQLNALVGLERVDALYTANVLGSPAGRE